MTALEKVLKRQRDNEMKSLDDYYGIVRQLAADEFLEDDAVTDAVHFANKSMAGLARDVERTRQRLEWKEKVDSLQQIEKQLAAESETWRRLDEEFEAVQRKHEEQCQPHEDAIRDLRRRRLEAEQARRDPQATVVDTRVQERQADLLSQRKRLAGMHREQHELVSRVSTRLTDALARTGDSRYAEGETQQASVRLERERGQLAELEGQSAETDRQLEELQARMVELQASGRHSEIRADTRRLHAFGTGGPASRYRGMPRSSDREEDVRKAILAVARESPAHSFAGHRYDASTTRVWYIRSCLISAGPGGGWIWLDPPCRPDQFSWGSGGSPWSAMTAGKTVPRDYSPRPCIRTIVWRPQVAPMT